MCFQKRAHIDTSNAFCGDVRVPTLGNDSSNALGDDEDVDVECGECQKFIMSAENFAQNAVEKKAIKLFLENEKAYLDSEKGRLIHEILTKKEIRSEERRLKTQTAAVSTFSSSSTLILETMGIQQLPSS